MKNVQKEIIAKLRFWAKANIFLGIFYGIVIIINVLFGSFSLGLIAIIILIIMNISNINKHYKRFYEALK